MSPAANTINDIITNAVSSLTPIVGGLSTIAFIVAGLMYLSATANPTRMAVAKGALIHSCHWDSHYCFGRSAGSGADESACSGAGAVVQLQSGGFWRCPTEERPRHGGGAAADGGTRRPAPYGCSPGGSGTPSSPLTARDHLIMPSSALLSDP